VLKHELDILTDVIIWNIPITVCDGTIASSAIFILYGLNVDLDVNLKVQEQPFVYYKID